MNRIKFSFCFKLIVQFRWTDLWTESQRYLVAWSLCEIIAQMRLPWWKLAQMLLIIYYLIYWMAANIIETQIHEKTKIFFFTINLSNCLKNLNFKFIWELSNFLFLLKMAFWATLIPMADPLSLIYSELWWLQIPLFAPYLQVTGKFG